MAMAAAPKQLTGRHVLAMLLAFFGVIIAVNLTMAYLANSTWSGLVVANGYVASQSFGRDLARAEAQEALGWTVNLAPERGGLRMSFAGPTGAAIDGLTITGALQRPVTDREDQPLAFSALGGGAYQAPANLAPGVWEVEIDARGNGVADYHKIFRFFVKDVP